MNRKVCLFAPLVWVVLFVSTTRVQSQYAVQIDGDDAHIDFGVNADAVVSRTPDGKLATNVDLRVNGTLTASAVNATKVMCTALVVYQTIDATTIRATTATATTVNAATVNAAAVNSTNVNATTVNAAAVNAASVKSSGPITGASITAANGGAVNGGTAVFTSSITVGGGTPFQIYRTGVWFPTLSFGGVSTGFTYSGTPAGSYTQVGNLVTIAFYIQLTAKPILPGGAAIQGLPIPTAGLGIFFTIGLVSGMVLTDGAVVTCNPGGTQIGLMSPSSTGAFTAALNQNQFTNNTLLAGGGQYFA